MKNFYLDIYSLPSFDYQDEVLKAGHPFSIEEFNAITENLYRDIRDFEKNYNDDFLSVLKIAEKFLIMNLTSYIQLTQTLKRLDGFSIKSIDKDSYVSLIGKRAYGATYFYDFMDGKVPFLDYWLRGLYYSKFREFAKTMHTVIFEPKTDVVVYRRNHYVENSLKLHKIDYSIVADQFFWKNSQMPDKTDYFVFNNEKLNFFTNELKFLLFDSSCKKYMFTKDEEKTFADIINRIIYKVYYDYMHCLKHLEKKKISFKEIHSSTSGFYKTRVVFEVMKKFGIKTYSYMHSGSLTHIDYKFDPRAFIEYSIADGFYVFNKNDISKLQKVASKEKIDLDVRVMKSNMHSGLKDNIEIQKKNSFKKITYISPVFSGYMRYFGCADDLMSVSFEYNLFKLLQKIGDYEINIKTHPKGLKRNNDLITKLYPSVKILNEGLVSDLVNGDTDIFIMRMVDSTSFNEIVASQKPLILINDGNTELLTEEAQKFLKNRVAVVECYYENGLAKINDEELQNALQREYIMDFEFSKRFQYDS